MEVHLVLRGDENVAGEAAQGLPVEAHLVLRGDENGYANSPKGLAVEVHLVYEVVRTRRGLPNLQAGCKSTSFSRW